MGESYQTVPNVNDLVDGHPKELRLMLDEERRTGARIKVVGVGGGGGNAVSRMVQAGFEGVRVPGGQHRSPGPAGESRAGEAADRQQAHEGPRRGRRPERGPPGGARRHRQADSGARRRRHGVRDHRARRGTGTGAAPVIASLASELGALTIAVVTKPFKFEGRKRQTQAEAGLDALRDCVDTVITIPNERLLAIINRTTTFDEAFSTADDVLRQAIQGISDLILVPGLINLDFADVKTIMAGMGLATMGTGIGDGENRAMDAAKRAISSPLLEGRRSKAPAA